MIFKNQDVFDVALQSKNARFLMHLLNEQTGLNKRLPACLQVDRSTRRFGTKLLPFIIIGLVGYIVDLDTSILNRCGLLFALLIAIRFYAE